MDLLEKERIVKKNVIEIFKENFSTSETDEEILRLQPEKEFESNYITYYESILDMFFIETDQLEHITGKVHDTIKKVALLWNETPHSYAPWDLQ